MLSNAYFLAKFRFDTAENEPAKNLQNFPNFANPYPARRPRRSCRTNSSFGVVNANCPRHRRVSTASAAWRGAAMAFKFLAKFRQDVARFRLYRLRFFASKYAFCSIFQKLPDYLAEFFEIGRILQIFQHLHFFANFSRKLLIFKLIFC